jgi:hypothetical protein
MIRAARNEDLRSQLAETVQRQRTAIAQAIDAEYPDLAGHSAAAVASFMMALCDGLLIQWVLDPDAVPAAAEIFDAVGLVFGSRSE